MIHKQSIHSNNTRILDNPAFYLAAGDAYQFGVETHKRDSVQAYHCYRQAARLGSAEGWNRLGGCYQFGLGVAQNYQFAVGAYYLASKQYHLPAIKNLAYCFEQGIGLNKNSQLAKSCSEYYERLHRCLQLTPKTADTQTSRTIARFQKPYLNLQARASDLTFAQTKLHCYFLPLYEGRTMSSLFWQTMKKSTQTTPIKQQGQNELN